MGRTHYLLGENKKRLGEKAKENTRHAPAPTRKIKKTLSLRITVFELKKTITKIHKQKI